MPRGLKIALLVLGALLALAGGWVGYQLYTAANPDLPEPLDRLAEVGLRGRAGEPIRLGSLTRDGVPTIVSFWASWCAPCQQEARAFGRLRRDYPADKLNIIYVNADAKDTPEQMAAFFAKAGDPDLPMLRGDGRAFAKVTGQTIVVLPRTYLFGSDGRPTAVFTGYGDDAEQELRDAVGALIRS